MNDNNFRRRLLFKLFNKFLNINSTFNYGFREEYIVNGITYSGQPRINNNPIKVGDEATIKRIYFIKNKTSYKVKVTYYKSSFASFSIPNKSYTVLNPYEEIKIGSYTITAIAKIDSSTGYPIWLGTSNEKNNQEGYKLNNIISVERA